MKQCAIDLPWSKHFIYSLHQAHFLILKRLGEVLQEKELISFSQFMILLAVECKSSIPQREVARILSLTEATVSRHIDGLSKSGLIERTNNPNSRREHQIVITKEGSKILQKAKSFIDQEINQIIGDIPNKEQEIITKNLQSLIQTLETRTTS